METHKCMGDFFSSFAKIIEKNGTNTIHFIHLTFTESKQLRADKTQSPGLKGQSGGFLDI